MRKNRQISILLVLAMMCSIFVVPTGAVDVTGRADRAAFAGKTMKCLVEVANFNGEITKSYTINVPIPKEATATEQMSLVQTAAMNAQMYNTRAGIFEDISVEDLRVTVTPNYEPWVGGGKLAKAYKTIMVQFDGLMVYNHAEKLLVRMTNQSQPGYNFYTETDKIYGSDTYVLFITGESYGSPALKLAKNDIIDVYASSSNGGISLRTCTVSGSIYTG